MSIAEIVWGTPWWVFVIFIYLMIIGMNATRSHSVWPIRFIIIPLIFGALFLFGLKNQTETHLIGISIATFVIGLFLGWCFFKPHVRIDYLNNLIHMRGSLTPLILYMLFFATSYFFGSTYAGNPQLHDELSYKIANAGLTSILSGIIIARCAHVFYEYMKNKDK